MCGRQAEALGGVEAQRYRHDAKAVIVAPQQRLEAGGSVDYHRNAGLALEREPRRLRNAAAERRDGDDETDPAEIEDGEANRIEHPAFGIDIGEKWSVSARLGCNRGGNEGEGGHQREGTPRPGAAGGGEDGPARAGVPEDAITTAPAATPSRAARRCSSSYTRAEP